MSRTKDQNQDEMEKDMKMTKTVIIIMQLPQLVHHLPLLLCHPSPLPSSGKNKVSEKRRIKRKVLLLPAL